MKYAATPATAYPIIDFIKTFCKTSVDANAERTKNEVETGTPNRVRSSRTAGASA